MRCGDRKSVFELLSEMFKHLQVSDRYGSKVGIGGEELPSVKLVYSLKDEKTGLAERVLDELHAESRMFVDKIGP